MASAHQFASSRFDAYRTVVVTDECRTVTRPAQVTELKNGKPYLIDYEAGHRDTLVVPEGAKVCCVAEPPSDVGMRHGYLLCLACPLRHVSYGMTKRHNAADR
ncbi:MAG: hypothetical protein KatS3mg104_0223 [Phycisphaerae bacterium]|jgi:hypothetical protein|nr:MAG: hypothetical protein KatS3mg104_0223 [Phycisphaerae bacterium]